MTIAEDIARQHWHPETQTIFYNTLVRQITEAVEREREECAQRADDMDTQIVMWDRPGSPPGNGVRHYSGHEIAAAIRSRHTDKAGD